jgi:hypothetical protein
MCTHVIVRLLIARSDRNNIPRDKPARLSVQGSRGTLRTCISCSTRSTLVSHGSTVSQGYHAGVRQVRRSAEIWVRGKASPCLDMEYGHLIVGSPSTTPAHWTRMVRSPGATAVKRPACAAQEHTGPRVPRPGVDDLRGGVFIWSVAVHVSGGLVSLGVAFAREALGFVRGGMAHGLLSDTWAATRKVAADCNLMV